MPSSVSFIVAPSGPPSACASTTDAESNANRPNFTGSCFTLMSPFGVRSFALDAAQSQAGAFSPL